MIQRRKPIKRTALKRSTKPIRQRRSKPRRGPAGVPADRWRNPAYRAFLREHGRCWACRAMVPTPPGERKPLQPHGVFGCDPMHGPPAGMRQKGPDAECIPGCRAHHDEQTRIGWPAFEAKYGFFRSVEAKIWWKAFEIWKEL